MKNTQQSDGFFPSFFRTPSPFATQLQLQLELLYVEDLLTSYMNWWMGRYQSFVAALLCLVVALVVLFRWGNFAEYPTTAAQNLRRDVPLADGVIPTQQQCPKIATSGQNSSNSSSLIDSFRLPQDETHLVATHRRLLNSAPLFAENMMRKVLVKEVDPWPELKVACLVHAFKGHDEHVFDAWDQFGRHCHRFFVATDSTEIKQRIEVLIGREIERKRMSEEDGELYIRRINVINSNLVSGYDYQNNWEKVRVALNWIVDNGFADSPPAKEIVRLEKVFDFLLVVGDDSLVIWSNMKAMLNEWRVAHAAGAPLYLGHVMNTLQDDNHLFCAGAGYLLNKAASHQFRSVSDRCLVGARCFCDDVYVAKCLAKTGVLPIDTADAFAEVRVHVMELGRMTSQLKHNHTDWWDPMHSPSLRRDSRPLPTGNNFVSVSSYIFHYLKGDLRRQYFRYFLRNHAVTQADLLTAASDDVTSILALGHHHHKPSPP